jgi:hypothetical protein
MTNRPKAKLDSLKSVNSEMTRRFGRWLIAQKYSDSTYERYCRIAR